ncbi:MAG TPA: hypothetical protein VJZ26_02685 [Blastocatellia bacterium]|nr:hypothetical protein [Blastocatellia bacterium]
MSSVLRILLIVMCAAFAVAALRTSERDAKALPLFARRLGVGCATCHTSPPRLNETGYRFRAAGFRMPEEIGKENSKPFKLTDYVGIRLQARWDEARSKTDIESETKSHFDLFAAEGYFFYGPWGKYLSSNLKATIYPEKSADTEGHFRLEGNLKLNVGNADRFVELKAGVPHPMEGFGASDVAIGDTRPYFAENPANFNQTTFFTPWNFHQAGIVAGYYQGRTSVRAYMLEGIRIDKDEDKVEPFGRREPFSKDIPNTRHGTPDMQIFVNRILNHNAGSVSLYYYRGNATLPVFDNQANKFTDAVFQDHFNRVAAFASYPVLNKLTVFGGAQRGRDSVAQGGRFTSLGAYAEGAVPVFNDLTHAGVRYDWFDPARGKSNNEVRGITTYINAWWHDQFRFVGEYRHLNVKRGLLSSRKDDAFQLRIIFIK